MVQEKREIILDSSLSLLKNGANHTLPGLLKLSLTYCHYTCAVLPLYKV